MDEKMMQQLFAEMIECTGEAIGLVASGFARHSDAARLTEDLRAVIQAAAALHRPTLAIRLATYALAAVEAESRLQNPPKH